MNRKILAISCLPLFVYGMDIPSNNPESSSAIQSVQISETSLCEAISHGHIDLVNALIEKGADVNANMPLFAAALHGDGQIAQVLIRNGADVNAIDESGRTPLILAIMRENKGAVNALIHGGADVNVNHNAKIKYDNPWDNATPLHKAAMHKNPEIIRDLVGHGADVSKTSYKGMTPLHYFASRSLCGYEDKIYNMVWYLGGQRAKISINAVDEYGKTPLHYAAESKYLDIISALIEMGANINAVDKYGKTPLDYAEEKGAIDAVSILKGRMAKKANELK
ncbi:MAG: ankyrin repeat domain-containing protein [Alphaproteobacteria bacterium]|nr:ankyrin repeat domain-containing protein [Alphaproteobacteria bacterium]